jgi:hypothetical protein
MRRTAHPFIRQLVEAEGGFVLVILRKKNCGKKRTRRSLG